MEIIFIVCGRDISIVLQTHEISLRKTNSHDLYRVITHSLVLVIVLSIEEYRDNTLCRTMACFDFISISFISGGDHVVLTTFCGYYPCVYYFYVPWLNMTSQWVMTLIRMPHCGITVGNDIARDMHCDITMGNDVAMCMYHGITLHKDVAMNLFC